MKPAAAVVRLSELQAYHDWVWRADHGDQAELRSADIRAVAATHEGWGWLRVYRTTDDHGVARVRVERRRTRRA